MDETCSPEYCKLIPSFRWPASVPSYRNFCRNVPGPLLECPKRFLQARPSCLGGDVLGLLRTENTAGLEGEVLAVPRQPPAAGLARESRLLSPRSLAPIPRDSLLCSQSAHPSFSPTLARAGHLGVYHWPLACCRCSVPWGGLGTGDTLGFGLAGLGCQAESRRGRIRARIASPGGRQPGGAERGEAARTALRACATSPPLRACTARLAVRRGGQVVRRRSRKPKIAGSNPVRAWGGSWPLLILWHFSLLDSARASSGPSSNLLLNRLVTPRARQLSPSCAAPVGDRLHRLPCAAVGVVWPTGSRIFLWGRRSSRAAASVLRFPFKASCTGLARRLLPGCEGICEVRPVGA